MKKFLSLALALCLILSALFSFSACNSAKVKAKDFEKNPQEAFDSAVSNTTDKYFPDDAGIEKIIEQALKLGSVSVSFEAEDLLGEGAISETIYIDSENRKYVSDTASSIMGMDLAARLFIDSNGIAVSGESLLGSDVTLLVNTAKLATDFLDSDLATLMGFTGEATDGFTEAMTVLKDVWAKVFEKPNKDTLDFINECYRLLNMETKTEDVEIADGKSVKCVIVTYRMDNDAMKALCKHVLDEYITDSEIKSDIEDAYEDMLKELEIDISYQLCIAQKTNEVVKYAITGSLEADGEEATMEIEATFGEKEIRADVKVDIPYEDVVEATLVLGREEKDGEVIYSLSINGKSGSVTVDLLNATYTYTKSNGEFVLEIDVFSDDNTRMEFELRGKVQVEKDSATIVFTSIKVDREKVRFNLTITFRVLDKIPQLPEDAKDITAISTEDWAEIMTDLQNSPLGQMIFGAADQDTME